MESDSTADWRKTRSNASSQSRSVCSAGVKRSSSLPFLLLKNQLGQHTAKRVIKETRASKVGTRRECASAKGVTTGQFKSFTREQGRWEENCLCLIVTWGSSRSSAHTGNYNYANEAQSHVLEQKQYHVCKQKASSTFTCAFKSTQTQIHGHYHANAPNKMG